MKFHFGERCQPQGLYLVLTCMSLEAIFQINRCLQGSLIPDTVLLCRVVTLCRVGGQK